MDSVGAGRALTTVASLSDGGGDDEDEDQQDGDSRQQEVALDLASLQLRERESRCRVLPLPTASHPGGQWACDLQGAGPTRGQGPCRTCPLQGALP